MLQVVTSQRVPQELDADWAEREAKGQTEGEDELISGWSEEIMETVIKANGTDNAVVIKTSQIVGYRRFCSKEEPSPTGTYLKAMGLLVGASIEVDIKVTLRSPRTASKLVTFTELYGFNF
jgi:hypothetical protein